MSAGLRVALVGATGAVGTTMLDVMSSRGLPVSGGGALRLRALGRQVAAVRPESLEVRALGAEPVEGFDVALFSAGGTISKEWAPRFAAEGCVVVDNSSAWRMEPNVPLVVAEVNPDAIDRHEGIVANPNCSTMQMVMALKPIHDEARIERDRGLDLPVDLRHRPAGDRGAARPGARDAARQGPRRRRSIRTRSRSTSCRRWRPSRTATTTPPRSAR